MWHPNTGTNSYQVGEKDAESIAQEIQAIDQAFIYLEDHDWVCRTQTSLEVVQIKESGLWTVHIT